MARPRLPVAKADITGAAAKNPGRHANRKDPSTVPLDQPSTFLDEYGAAAWEGFKLVRTKENNPISVRLIR